MSTEDKNLSKFIEVYEKYKNVVFDAAMAQCDNYHTSQEITQEVFAECYTKKIYLEEDIDLLVWFKLSARNRAVDHWRRTHKEELRYAMHETDIVGEFASMDELYIHEVDKCDRVERGYSTLEAMRRKNQRWFDYIMMSYFYGMTEKEIAEKDDTTLYTVKNVIRRAKEWAEKHNSKNEDT